MSQRGRRPGSGSNRPVDTYDDGRRCRASGCDTVLSRYTKGEYCWQHQQRSKPRPAPYI